MPIGFGRSILSRTAEGPAPATNMFLDLFQSNMDTAVTLPTSNNSWVTLKYDDNTYNTNSFITVGAGNDTFTVDETGLYLIQFSCSMTGNVSNVRVSHTTRITVNGTAVECGGSSNYPRGSNVFDDNNLHIGLLKLTANDVVRCQVAMSPYETLTGITAYTLNVNNNKSMLTIAKLADNDLCRLGVSSDTTISAGKGDYKGNSGAEDDVEWNSQVEVDTASFAHSTGTNPEEITLKSAGKYLITGGLLVEKDGTGRSTQIFNLKSNDSNYSASGFDYTGIMAASYTRGTLTNKKKYAPFCGVIETADANSKIKFTHHLNIGSTNTEGMTHEVGSNIQILKLNDVPAGTYRLDTAATYDNGANNAGIGDDETGQFDTTITQDTGVSRSSNSFTCSSGNYYMVLGNIGWSGMNKDTESERMTVDIGVDVSGTGRIPTGFGCQYYRMNRVLSNVSNGGDEMSTPFFAIVDATAADKTFDMDIDTHEPWVTYDPADTGTGTGQTPYNVSNKPNQPALKNSMGIIQMDI